MLHTELKKEKSLRVSGAFVFLPGKCVPFTSSVLSGHVVQKLPSWVLSCSAVPQGEMVQREHILLVCGGQERPGEGTKTSLNTKLMRAAA